MMPIKTMFPPLIALFMLALLPACTPPVPTTTPTLPSPPTAVPTPTAATLNYDGQWDAGTLPDGLLSGELIFQIEKNKVTNSVSAMRRFASPSLTAITLRCGHRGHGR